MQAVCQACRCAAESRRPATVDESQTVTVAGRRVIRRTDRYPASDPDGSVEAALTRRGGRIGTEFASILGSFQDGDAVTPTAGVFHRPQTPDPTRQVMRSFSPKSANLHPAVVKLLTAAALAWIAFGLLALMPKPLFAKTWTDPSGRYKVEAELVAADPSKAVLRNDEGELLVMQLEQLSKADRDYVEDFLDEQQRSSAAAGEAGETSEADRPRRDDEPRRDDPPSQDWDLPKASAKRQTDSKWKLKDGQTVRGRLLGFGRETLVLARRDGHVLVDGTPFDELPPAYQKIVPDVVSRIDKVDIGDQESLEDHLIDGGAGPFRYTVAGIQIEDRDGDVVTIPVSLLRSADREAVEPGMRRWMAAQQQGVSEQVRRETADTERLLLDSHQRRRSRQSAYGDAATSSPLVDAVRMVDLQLQAAAAGVTDIWEVLLYPPTPYGYPRTVVVSAENSRGAMISATRHYPGWRVGPARKLSF